MHARNNKTAGNPRVTLKKLASARNYHKRAVKEKKKKKLPWHRQKQSHASSPTNSVLECQYIKKGGATLYNSRVKKKNLWGGQS